MLRPGKGLPTSYGNNAGYGAEGGYGGGGGGGGGYNGGGYGYGGSGYGGSSAGYDGYGAGYGGDNSNSNSNSSSNSSSSNNSKKGKSKNPFGHLDQGSNLLDRFVGVCLVALLFFGATLHYRGQARWVLKRFDASSMDEVTRQYEKMEQEQARWQREAQTAQDTHRRMKESIDNLEREGKDMRKRQDEIRVKHEGTSLANALAAVNGMSSLSQDEETKLRNREEAWRKQVHLLQNATSRESKREALERFGGGPHVVTFFIQIPGEEEESSFSVEMAPLELMPHAVHLFLEQVLHELWDNTWFYLNGPHVLQAGPQDWEDESTARAIQPFLDTQLDTLAFPEYSPEYPHVPWTLGFTGRPGGPDWYINKVDNTQAHGPGGQYQHDLQEQADPCFAKVNGGHAVLGRVFAKSVYPHNHDYAYFLQEPVEILRVRIQDETQKKIPKRPRVIHRDHLPPAP